jgi:NitT/TauT family transport system permease protein
MQWIPAPWKQWLAAPKAEKALGVLALAFLLVVWQVIASQIGVDFIMPTPFLVVEVLLEIVLSVEGWADIAYSMFRLLTGFIAGMVCSIIVGLAIGVSPKVRAAIEPLMNFTRFTPLPAYLPLFILWFGISEMEKILIIFISVFFQASLDIGKTISFTPKEFIEFGHSLKLSALQQIKSIILPFHAPTIFDIGRISLGWAWAALMFAEIVGSQFGLGAIIIHGQRLLQTERIFAGLILLGVLGLMVDRVMLFGRKKMFKWKKEVKV